MPARACALSAAPQLQPASLRRRDQHGAARATPCVAAWLPRSAGEACLHRGGLALCGGLVARALGALAVKTRQEADSSSRAAAASVPASARAPRQLGSVSFSIRARGGGASGRASSRQMSWDVSLGCPLWCACPNSSEQRGRAQLIAYDHPIAHPQRDTRRSWPGWLCARVGESCAEWTSRRVVVRTCGGGTRQHSRACNAARRSDALAGAQHNASRRASVAPQLAGL